MLLERVAGREGGREGAREGGRDGGRDEVALDDCGLFLLLEVPRAARSDSRKAKPLGDSGCDRVRILSGVRLGENVREK